MPNPNPFGDLSPEDQAALRTQLVNLSSQEGLGEGQKRNVALALTALGSSSGFPSQSLPNSPPPEPPSMWDKANTGLVNPETILKLANLPGTVMNKISGGRTPKPLTMADLLKAREGNPATSPVKNALTTGIAGTDVDALNTASGFTSPVSLATLAAGPFTKGAGVVPKTLRTLMTALGLTYGAQGLSNTAEGIGKGITTPEGAQQTLGGLAQVAGSAPAAAEMGAVLKGAASHMVPQAFAEGENALVKVLNPDRKAVPALRSAYQVAAPELANAPVKDLPDLENYASVKRTDAANRLKAELAKINPQAVRIDPNAVYLAIRKQITHPMFLASPTEAEAIGHYAENVKGFLANNPIDIAQAEQMSQQITSRTAAFDRMSPDAKRQASAQGDLTVGEKAFKQALQDQIEAKLSNYRDLKAQYGAWKEIQNQTNSQLDKLAKQNPNANWIQRRAIEGLFGAGGVLLGGQHGEMIGGGAAGYLLGRLAADAYLNRLASPERMLQRAIKPQVSRPIPFTGQVVQPVAQSLIQGGGTAF